MLLPHCLLHLLAVAASQDRTECAQALLSHGADPSVKSADDGKTALEIANGKGHAKTAAILKDAAFKFKLAEVMGGAEL